MIPHVQNHEFPHHDKLSLLTLNCEITLTCSVIVIMFNCSSQSCWVMNTQYLDSHTYISYHVMSHSDHVYVAKIQNIIVFSIYQLSDHVKQLSIISVSSVGSST